MNGDTYSSRGMAPSTTIPKREDGATTDKKVSTDRQWFIEDYHTHGTLTRQVVNIESGNVKIDIPAENEEVVGANENGIEIVEQRGEMLEGTTMKGRRAETTETYLTIDVVAEVAEGGGDRGDRGERGDRGDRDRGDRGHRDDGGFAAQRAAKREKSASPHQRRRSPHQI
ncbi:hypothetical protein DID88_007679 [Monilinia fructigena]|uniref:Uncharacterized protein n=1 Tax=Monilinia fructigena TaxID=38457 RepID=A0A395J301_9HELO|nr:hypothetical protein DID88_007679 [Monilinia fructigena]